MAKKEISKKSYGGTVKCHYDCRCVNVSGSSTRDCLLKDIEVGQSVQVASLFLGRWANISPLTTLNPSRLISFMDVSIISVTSYF